MTEEIQKPILDFDEYSEWDSICIESIKYKDKTLVEWSQKLTLPNLDLQSLNEIEHANIQAMKITELIGLHASLTKSSYLLAKASYQNKLNIEKNNILDELVNSPKRAPSQDTLERMALNNCLKEWRLMVKSELVYEFWQTHSYKLNQIHNRLTSLNILKNIETKQLGN